MQRRVVITGLGVLAPNGTGKEDFWQACIAGRSGIRRITRFDATPFPTQIAGEVADFDPVASGLTQDEYVRLDRGTQFAIAAANMALADGLMCSGDPSAPLARRQCGRHENEDRHIDGRHIHLDEAQRERMGVYIGAAVASVEEGEKLWVQVTDRGAHPPRALMDGFAPDRFTMGFVPAAAIAAHHQLYGPCMTVSTGCSAGADAIGQAYWCIQEGRADRMLAGGSDSAINGGGINVFCVMRALSTRNDEPERASRPYDAGRDGFVMAEGAGVLLLEERELALARHAPIYAEIIAFSSNSNAYHMTALPDDGAPLQHLLRQALEEARITSRQLGYINSHGSSTPPNEAAETAAYKAIFGEQAYHIPISATKSMIGHTQGAASAIETIVTALTLARQIIPPTINQEEADPRCDLDYVPNTARHLQPVGAGEGLPSLSVALTHSSGFGGVNTALVLAHPNWHDSQEEQLAYADVHDVAPREFTLPARQ
ncbi:MAG: beta-ketoacyl-[acyl-carrier-protein] synthase family protein [Ktedonobacteraceae bacterium]|nr:beta-ketoacyl-[acyl-carrier-protein] synthase family protein [Ktedonobacteraceae bacterium]